MGDNSFDPAEPRIMAHLVAGFPDMPASLAAALALAEAGAAYLEIQFPFSDPSADGPVIQTACARSLAAGFRVQEGFELVRRVSRETGRPVFIMSYASPAVARGLPAFCEDAVQAGAAGLIIPDLAPDADEGLYEEGRARGLAVLPLVAPGMRDERLRRILAMRSEYIYAALRRGITGQETEMGAENLALLEAAASGGAKVMAGFGVRGPAQVRVLAPRVHAAIVGTAFTEVVMQAAAGGPAAVAEALAARYRTFAA